MKILLLEDELMLQQAIEEYLRSLGHVVSSFSRGDEALDIIKKEAFDMLVLDINVPSIDGFELLEYMKQLDIFTPTLFISALIEIDDITKAFSLGAYDYLKKPFHLQELGLRINNITKTLERQNREHILLSENYSYSKKHNELRYFSKVQTLTKKQTLMLALLCQNIDIVISLDKFRSYVWNHEPVEDATMRSEINRFRRVLKEDFIQNIKGIGYKVERYIKV